MTNFNTKFHKTLPQTGLPHRSLNKEKNWRYLLRPRSIPVVAIRISPATPAQIAPNLSHLRRHDQTYAYRAMHAQSRP